MKIGKPAIGYAHMRKLTSNEVKEIKFDRKILTKLLIMTEDAGLVSFWIPKHRSNEVKLFVGSDVEYFDANKAALALEHFWKRFEVQAVNLQ